jgi:uncharacterized Zn finger protein
MDQMQMNINLEDTTEIKCENCNNNVFNQGVMLRGISRFITGTAQDGVMPIPVFACSKCGHVNTQFLPKQKPEDESQSIEEETPKKSPFTIIR